MFKDFSKIIALIIAAYLLLGVVFTYPLVKNFNNKIPNNMYAAARHSYIWGDHLQILSGFREHKNIVKNFLNGNPNYEKELCVGSVESCAISNSTTMKKFVFSAFWMHTFFNVLLTDVQTYNTVILLSFVTTGLATFYLLSQFITKQIPYKLRMLVIFVGTLFPVLAPLRLQQLFVGHKNAFLYPIVILIMGLIEPILNNTNDKNNVIYKIILAFLLIYLGFTEQLLLLYALIYLSLRVAWFELVENKLIEKFKGGKLKTIFDSILNYTWLIFSVVLVYLFNMTDKIQDISNSLVNSGRSLDEIESYSPEVKDFFTQRILEHETNIYLGVGILVILLAVFTIYKMRKNHGRMIFALLAIGIFAFLALGTNTPAYEWIYNNIPIIKFSRTPGRIAFLIYPILGILWVLVCNYWSQTKLFYSSKISYLVNLLAVLLITINLYSFDYINLTKLPVNETFVANDKKILFLPMTSPGHFFGSVYEYQLSQTNSVSMNGYDPFPSEEAEEFYNTYGLFLNSRARFDPEFFESDEFEFIKEAYKIDEVIILDEFINLNVE